MRKARSLAALSAVVVSAALSLSGCAAEKEYPGGDNDDTRKPAAAAPTIATPSTAPTAAGTSRDKPGSAAAGGR